MGCLVFQFHLPLGRGLPEGPAEALPSLCSALVVWALSPLPWVVSFPSAVAAADLCRVVLVRAFVGVVAACAVPTLWLCLTGLLYVPPPVALEAEGRLEPMVVEACSVQYPLDDYTLLYRLFLDLCHWDVYYQRCV